MSVQIKQRGDRSNAHFAGKFFIPWFPVEPQAGLTRDELANLLGSLRMKPVPDWETLIAEARRFSPDQSDDFSSRDIGGRALWSYVRHHLTNYDEIRAAIKARVGESGLYENVKAYLCCRIIREYGLEVDPLYAAFGENGSYGRIPDRFIVENLEATVAPLILEEFLKGR